MRVEDIRNSEFISKTRREGNLSIERIHRRVSMMESLTRNENCKKNLSARTTYAMTRPRPYYCTHSQSRKLTKNPNDGKCQRTAYEHYPLNRRRIAEYSTRRSTYRPPEQRKQRLSGFGLLTLLAPSTKFRYILFRHTSFYPPNNRPQFSLSHRRNYEPTCETNLPTKVPPRIRLVDLSSGGNGSRPKPYATALQNAYRRSL